MTRLFTSLSLLALSSTVFAQTDPEPFDLSSGDYTFNNWPAESEPGTYPPNMVFHVYGLESVNPDVNSPITGDWLCAYNLELRSRIMGMGEDGFAFANAASAQSTEQQCLGGPGATGSYVGAATIALNTTGLPAVNVLYVATNITVPEIGFELREYRIRAEYRVGTSGDFTAVDGSTLSSASTSPGAIEVVNFSLPSEALNQPVVQLRVRFYQADANEEGQRPRWQIGNWTVSTNALVSTSTSMKAEPLTAYPNPSSDGLFKLNRPLSATIYDISGKVAMEISNTQVLNMSQLNAGVYLLKSNEGEVIRLFKN